MRASTFAKAAGAAAGAARSADRRFTWGERLAAVPGMVAATLTGRFTGASRGGIALAVLGLVYVISPLDVIPEAFLGPFGLADDAGILAIAAGYLVAASDRYLHWKLGTVPGSGAGGPASGGRTGAPDVVQGTVIKG